MGWVDAELVLVSLGAMLLPTTLMFCVLALVLGERPLKTGILFYLGALTATLAIGVAAAFVLGDVASSDTPSQPKTWVAVLDLALGGLLLLWVARTARKAVRPGQDLRDGRQDERHRVIAVDRRHRAPARCSRIRACSSRSR